MEYDAQGHIIVKSREYPKVMHDGKGHTIDALDLGHERELNSQGWSSKVHDPAVHGQGKVPA